MPEPIEWRTIEDAMYTWITDSTGLTAVWANQNVVQPRYPYASLQIISGPTKEAGVDELRTTTDLGAAAGQEITMQTVGMRLVTLNAQVHVGPPDDNNPDSHARHLMSVAQAALNAESARSKFRVANIAVIDEGDIIDTSLVVGQEWIARASMDVRFRVTSCYTEQVGYIERVSVDGTFEGTKTTPSPLDFTDEEFGDIP